MSHTRCTWRITKCFLSPGQKILPNTEVQCVYLRMFTVLFLLNPGNKNIIPSLLFIFPTSIGNNIYPILCLWLKRSHFTRKTKVISPQGGPTYSYLLLDLRETVNTKKDTSYQSSQKLFDIACVYRAVLCQTTLKPHHCRLLRA